MSRPNRFAAIVEIDGKNQICHVKNTGRLKELLVPGSTVFVQEASAGNRKTKYDLIAVDKGSRLINIDSQAPNRIFYEWVKRGNLFSSEAVIKPEARYNNSRFDFYIEDGDRKAYVEVKGVTLEADGVAMFPDAPTERGVKHIHELCACLEDGFEAFVVFIIQMKNVNHFSPNRKTHPAFGDALSYAAGCGVKIIALDCDVTKNTIEARAFVDVKLND